MFQNIISQKSYILKYKELAQKHFWLILPLKVQGMAQIILISLIIKYTENWKDKHRK